METHCHAGQYYPKISLTQKLIPRVYLQNQMPQEFLNVWEVCCLVRTLRRWEIDMDSCSTFTRSPVCGTLVYQNHLCDLGKVLS